MLKVKISGALDAHINTQGCKNMSEVMKRLSDEIKYTEDKMGEYAL
jgi:hypothetical protein